MVAEQSNMDALPYNLDGVVPGIGDEFRVARRSQVLHPYWEKFAQLSQYEMRFAPQKGLVPLLTTKNPNHVVSGVVSYQGGGHLVLLPAINLRDSKGVNRGGSAYRLNSIEFVRRLLEVNAQLSGGPTSPPPDWAQAGKYETAGQHKLREELLKVQEAEAQARRQREELLAALEDGSVLQGLLFAQGRLLEDAVVCGLKLMGVEAVRIAEGESEFDAVFTIDGRRMLGEAEGRDSAAIAIDKITQLERNIAEDFARGDVVEHAHGVLFGNPQRLVDPEERTRTFTEKCMSSAKRNGFALVLTHKMFEAAAYLEESDDSEYAEACRSAFLAAKGQLVEFPEVPGACGASTNSEASAIPGTE
ncbi:MAG: hypothetical protein OXG11_06165 [Chloroflexi bacterium]|nr:hypothetical protein [Chloroflexota bacterium]